MIAKQEEVSPDHDVLWELDELVKRRKEPPSPEVLALRKEVERLKAELAANNEKFYSPKEFAGKMEVNIMTIYTWIWSKKLRVVQPKGKWGKIWIPVSELSRLKTA